jgi:hypothetical protein
VLQLEGIACGKHRVARLAHRTLEDMGHVQLFGNLGKLDVPALVRSTLRRFSSLNRDSVWFFLILKPNRNPSWGCPPSPYCLPLPLAQAAFLDNRVVLHLRGLGRGARR